MAKPNSGLFAETDPIHIGYFLVSGIPLESFDKINRLENTHLNLIDLVVILSPEMELVLVGEKVIRGSLANGAIGEMQHQIILHDLLSLLLDSGQAVGVDSRPKNHSQEPQESPLQEIKTG